MNRKIRILQGILFLFLLVASASCKNGKDSVRKYERMEKKMMKEGEKSLEEAQKGHLTIQSKATRKMMRDAKKRAKKLNKPKKR